jgi:hypothetical protein
MSYVVRFTKNPQYDIQRNWSAWMGMEWDTRREAIVENLELSGVSEDAVEDSWEAWQNEALRAYHVRNHSDYDAFLEDMADDHNIDVRYHEGTKTWMVVHHDGLSVFPLGAESAEDAIKEAECKNFSWSGFGHQTLGKIEFVATINEEECLHLFWCEDTMPEN